MWFLNPKRRVRAIALEIVNGLRDGTLVPDPPLERDIDESLPQVDKSNGVAGTSQPRVDMLYRLGGTPWVVADKAVV